MKYDKDYIFKYLMNALKDSEFRQCWERANGSAFKRMDEDCEIKAKSARCSGHTTALLRVTKKIRERPILVLMPNNAMINHFRFDFEKNVVLISHMAFNKQKINGRFFQFIFVDCASFVWQNQTGNQEFKDFVRDCHLHFWNKEEPFFYVEIE